MSRELVRSAALLLGLLIWGLISGRQEWTRTDLAGIIVVLLVIAVVWELGRQLSRKVNR